MGHNTGRHCRTNMDLSALEIIAVVFLSVLGLNAIRNVTSFLFTTFLGSWLQLNVDLRQYGPWAVVTGATDGIGKAYAKKLASMGLNIVLISRTPAKLKETKIELETMEPSIQVKIIAVDFTEDTAIYQRIAAELGDLKTGVLINNVGMCDNFCEPFTEIGSERVIDDLITCNVVSVPRMIHMILPGMLQRKRGVIINIGSLAGVVGTPLVTLYGATKAFVVKFSRDLEYELRGSGVIVQTVALSVVLTKMVKNSTQVQASIAAPLADEYVKANLRTLGLESFTASYWFHKIQIALLTTIEYFFPTLTRFASMRRFKKLNLS